MALAIHIQLSEDFCPYSRLAPTSCLFVPVGTPDPDILELRLEDTIDDPNALAYHTEDSTGKIWGPISCGDILDAGGGILDGGTIGDSISAAASHEALEARRDPNCNAWLDREDGQQVADEVCDPCQAENYLKAGVLVSGFILPAWRDAFNTRGPYSWLETIKKPLDLAPGGYLIIRTTPADARQVFGASGNALPWRKGLRRFVRGVR